MKTAMCGEGIPHALKLVQGSEDLEEKYILYYWIGRYLQVDGRIREAVDYLDRCCSWREATLDETHPDRLASEGWLAYMMDNLRVQDEDIGSGKEED